MANDVGQGKGQEEIAAEKRYEAFELAKKGHTYRQIGKQLGVSHVTALKYVKTVLKELAEETKEVAKEYIEIELKRLDNMIMVLSERVSRGENEAIETTLRIMARRAKYLGFDTPIELTHSGKISLEDFVGGSMIGKDEQQKT